MFSRKRNSRYSRIKLGNNLVAAPVDVHARLLCSSSTPDLSSTNTFRSLSSSTSSSTTSLILSPKAKIRHSPKSKNRLLQEHVHLSTPRFRTSSCFRKHRSPKIDHDSSGDEDDDAEEAEKRMSDTEDIDGFGFSRKRANTCEDLTELISLEDEPNTNVLPQQQLEQEQKDPFSDIDSHLLEQDFESDVKIEEENQLRELKHSPILSPSLSLFEKDQQSSSCLLSSPDENEKTPTSREVEEVAITDGEDLIPAFEESFVEATEIPTTTAEDTVKPKKSLDISRYWPIWLGDEDDSDVENDDNDTTAAKIEKDFESLEGGLMQSEKEEADKGLLFPPTRRKSTIEWLHTGHLLNLALQKPIATPVSLHTSAETAASSFTSLSDSSSIDHSIIDQMFEEDFGTNFPDYSNYSFSSATASSSSVQGATDMEMSYSYNLHSTFNYNADGESHGNNSDNNLECNDDSNGNHDNEGSKRENDRNMMDIQTHTGGLADTGEDVPYEHNNDSNVNRNSDMNNDNNYSKNVDDISDSDSDSNNESESDSDNFNSENNKQLNKSGNAAAVWKGAVTSECIKTLLSTPDSDETIDISHDQPGNGLDTYSESSHGNDCNSMINEETKSDLSCHGNIQSSANGTVSQCTTEENETDIMGKGDSKHHFTHNDEDEEEAQDHADQGQGLENYENLLEEEDLSSFIEVFLPSDDGHQDTNDNGDHGNDCSNKSDDNATTTSTTTSTATTSTVDLHIAAAEDDELEYDQHANNDTEDEELFTASTDVNKYDNKGDEQKSVLLNDINWPSLNNHNHHHNNNTYTGINIDLNGVNILNNTNHTSNSSNNNNNNISSSCFVQAKTPLPSLVFSDVEEGTCS